MIMTKFEKIETGLIIVFEVVLCTLKNGKKFRNLLKKKVSKQKQSKKQIKNRINMETNLLIAPSQNMMMVRSNDWKQDVEEAVLITEQPQKRSPFIESNTTEVTLDHLRNECIIPVFSKDNEVCISHQSFIESVYEATKDFYHGETIYNPDIRVSHIVKEEYQKRSIKEQINYWNRTKQCIMKE